MTQKPINPLDGSISFGYPDWAFVLYREFGSKNGDGSISLDDQFKPWCKLTEDLQQAIKDAYADGYQIWTWRMSAGDWFQLGTHPASFSGHIYAVGELREEFRQKEEDEWTPELGEVVEVSDLEHSWYPRIYVGFNEHHRCLNGTLSEDLKGVIDSDPDAKYIEIAWNNLRKAEPTKVIKKPDTGWKILGEPADWMILEDEGVVPEFEPFDFLDAEYFRGTTSEYITELQDSVNELARKVYELERKVK